MQAASGMDVRRRSHHLTRSLPLAANLPLQAEATSFMGHLQQLALAPYFRSDTRSVATGGGSGGEVHGVAVGPAIVMPSGVRVVREQLGTARVSDLQLRQILLGIAQLPVADQQLLASRGIEIHLLPTGGLEQGLLGATTIVRENASTPWRPTLVRVAVAAGGVGREANSEIVQHEIGHCVSVIERGDNSELAADTYAAEH